MINAKKQYRYGNKVLTYDPDKSRKTIIPIYHDVDGQLYTQLDERFVTINDVIAALEAYMCRGACAG